MPFIATYFIKYEKDVDDAFLGTGVFATLDALDEALVDEWASECNDILEDKELDEVIKDEARSDHSERVETWRNWLSEMRPAIEGSTGAHWFDDIEGGEFVVITRQPEIHTGSLTTSGTSN